MGKKKDQTMSPILIGGLFTAEPPKKPSTFN